MDRYRATARRRAAQRRRALEARREVAWETARRAAALLKTNYGSQRVVLFGSLSRDEPLSPYSDIDLAVWGLDERIYYRVVSQLLDSEPSIPIDLLRAEALDAELLRMIETTGVAL